jgi:hypothetical protein
MKIDPSEGGVEQFGDSCEGGLQNVLELDNAVDCLRDRIQRKQLAALFVQLTAVLNGEVNAGEPDCADGEDADKVHQPRRLSRKHHCADDRGHGNDYSGGSDHLRLLNRTKIANEFLSSGDRVSHLPSMYETMP